MDLATDEVCDLQCNVGCKHGGKLCRRWVESFEARPDAKECAVCGDMFAPQTPRQRRCPACIEAKPRVPVGSHMRYYELHGHR